MSDIYSILKQYWGYDKFRDLQEDIINSVLAGKDTLGLMPTGGGKSITFQVPGMLLDGICIVITPLIALMKDQKDNLRSKGIKAAAIYTGMKRHEILTALDNCLYGDYKFLYVSPERLSSELFLSKVRHMNVNMLVIDESHCISQWGYDFRPSYLKISEFRELIPHAPVLALTATATAEVVKDIQTKLDFKAENVFRKSFARENLAYIVRDVSDKHGKLLQILNSVQGTSVVYVRSRKKTKEISDYLNENDINADYYHAGLSPAIKEKKQDLWKKGECRVIVSTNAFGMGIDKANVRTVIHLDLPDSLEEYYQEAGRAGRDGEKAYAIILYNKSDQTKLKKRILDTFPERDFIKRVYHYLGSFYQIAEGAGFEAVFDFDLARFCASYSLPLNPTHHALKLIQQAGYIVYDENADTQSRIIFTVTRDELYRLKEFDAKTVKLINIVLRAYTGLFADYVYIREDLISLKTGLTNTEIYERLIMLSRQHILHYVPARKGAMVCFLKSRVEKEYMSIPRSVYEDRKERYSTRIGSMIKYASEDSVCRTKILLSYFGETNRSECNTCDVCIDKKTGKLTVSKFEVIQKEIMILLEGGCIECERLISSLNYEESLVIESIRFLLDENYIYEHENCYYKTKK